MAGELTGIKTGNHICSILLKSSLYPFLSTETRVLSQKVYYHLDRKSSSGEGRCTSPGSKMLKNTNGVRMEWSHHSLSTLHQRKFNQTELLPLTNDLEILHNYLLKHIAKLSKTLREVPTPVVVFAL